MKLPKRRKYILAVCLLILSAGAVGAAARPRIFDSNEKPRETPIVYAAFANHVTPVPAGSTLAEVANEIFKRYGGRRVLSVALTNPPLGREGVWLSFVAEIPAGFEEKGIGWQPGIVRAGWEADIIAGAITDAAAERNLGQIAGSSIAGRRPDGTIVEDIGGGIGAIVPGQAFTDETDAQIVSALSQGLSDAKLQPISIDVLHADQPAPAVVAETNSPGEAAAQASATIRTLFGSPHAPQFEGYYFEVRDTSGEPVFVQSYSYRSGSGRQWNSPAVEDAISLDHF